MSRAPRLCHPCLRLASAPLPRGTEPCGMCSGPALPVNFPERSREPGRPEAVRGFMPRWSRDAVSTGVSPLMFSSRLPAQVFCA